MRSIFALLGEAEVRVEVLVVLVRGNRLGVGGLRSAQAGAMRGVDSRCAT
jgi:hypothetical protein